VKVNSDDDLAGNNFDKDYIMLPVVDFVFKLLFGDMEHKERLISLLSAVLDLPEDIFGMIEIINSELPGLFEEDKKGILDIQARLSDGEKINIEIQVLPSDSMPERTLYYWAKMYNAQIKKGDTFDILKKCITVNIVDHDFLPFNKMHTRYHLTEDMTGHCLTDVLEVHFCELKKARRGTDIDDAEDPSIDWMRFIGAKSKGEMEMIAKKNKTIEDAFEQLKVISKDEKNRLAYEARQMWIMDQRTREKQVIRKSREQGREQGREEGRMEGSREKNYENARNFKNIGISIDIIAKATGLDIEEIRRME
jgi:predicted transposase/invertase (TIGR01784 family)